MILGRPYDAPAQQGGQISGAVYDQTGSALAGATLTVSGPASRDAKTDGSGRFEFRDLPSGDYDLTADLKGFERIHRAIHVQPGEAASLSLTMIVAVLEQTIVTAAKIGAADVQATPIAISAVSNAEVTRFDIRTIDQGVVLVPSVTFSQNGSYGQLTIRGIGTNAVNAGTDPSSAMYLDGVYLGRPAMVFADFLDLDRMEVLRGPQGTLYGRNAVGGAVNLISKTPTNEFQATARAAVGNFDERRVEGRVSGALKRDRVMGSVAVARGARDGYVRDLNHPGRPLGGDDLTAARGQLRFVLDRRTDVLVSSDVTNQTGTLLTFNKVLSVKPGFTVDNPPDLHEVRTSTTASSGLRQSGTTARVTSALTSTLTLSSITAFRKLNNEFHVDADVTELNLLQTNSFERQHQFSEELTMSQRRNGLTWVGGVFFFDEADHQQVFVDQFQTSTQVTLDALVKATSGAVFGETTVDLTSRLSGIAGLRYSHEGKDIDNHGGRYDVVPAVTAIPGTTYAYTDSIEHTAWTPKLGARMTLSPGAMTYFTATRGFKSGGFNFSSTQAGRGYAPEWAWNYEAGLKTAWLNGRARLDVAAFHTDYTNLQVQTPIGIGVFDIRNAAAATIRGVELEADGRVGRGLDAGGHLTWLDATYDEYVAVAIGGFTADVSGKRLNNAPVWSGRAWIEWTGNAGASKRLTLTADATAQSTVFYTPFNDDIQRQLPYGLLSARAEYGPSARRWAINAYARNLTSTDYIMATFGTSPAAFGGRPGAPRQFGVQMIVRR